MASPPISPLPQPTRPSPERLARIFEEEVYPLVGGRLGEMLLAAAELKPKSQVLEIGCSTGNVTVELAHRLDSDSRIVAMDGSSALLDIARTKVNEQEHAGRRVFFKSHRAGAKLPFADETHDTVLAQLAWHELPDPVGVLIDLARVCKPGGQIVIAVALRGTWGELLDIFKEVLVKVDRLEALMALQGHVESWPEAETVTAAMAAVGLTDVARALSRWELLFKSGREFLYAPVVELGPLPRWKDIAGHGEEMQDTFVAIKDAIDTYFSGHVFSVGVFAGCFVARKP